MLALNLRRCFIIFNNRISVRITTAFALRITYTRRLQFAFNLPALILLLLGSLRRRQTKDRVRGAHLFGC